MLCCIWRWQVRPVVAKHVKVIRFLINLSTRSRTNLRKWKQRACYQLIPLANVWCWRYRVGLSRRDRLFNWTVRIVSRYIGTDHLWIPPRILAVFQEWVGPGFLSSSRLPVLAILDRRVLVGWKANTSGKFLPHFRPVSNYSFQSQDPVARLRVWWRCWFLRPDYEPNRMRTQPPDIRREEK